MPSLSQVFLDPVSWIVFAIYFGLMGIEALFPARRQPAVRAWRLRGLVAFLTYFLLSTYLPFLWGDWLSTVQIADLSALGTWGGGLAGLVVFELGLYAWHRSLHASDFLWKHFHRKHHTAERLDIAGSYYFSIPDMIGFTVLTSLCLTLAGLTPQAALVANLLATFLSTFQHSNVRTPRWLGYIVQRPESHTVHHARGTHPYNYSDLPVFDLIFGTFRNPKEFEHPVGL